MTHNQLLIDMLMKLSNRVMRADELGGSRYWLVAELSVIISHAQDGPHERVFTESEVKAMALSAIKGIQKVLPQSPEHVRRAGGEIAKALLDVGITLDPS